MYINNKYLFLTLILCLSLNGTSQTQGEVFRLSEYGFNQIENRTHLEHHYIDSTSGLYRLRIRAGLSYNLNEVQLKLGYFNLIIHDTIVDYDEFFLGAFDTLVPGIIEACKEFGFYRLVHILEEINEHRDKTLSVFQSDTTKAIFDEYNDSFDHTLYKLRGKLAVICQDFELDGLYLDRLRSYMIENKDELIR